MNFKNYDTKGFYDELFEDANCPRPGTRALAKRIESLEEGELLNRQKSAEAALFNMGVTFTLYNESKDGKGIERIFPFDLIPRIIEPQDWDLIERGLKQRIHALNTFINDIYSDQKIIKDRIIPKDIVYSSKSYLSECNGLNPSKNIWCHINGTDIVRDKDGQFYVLEDNLRCPSGVSYVLENRHVLKRTIPKVFESGNILPVDDYHNHLLSMLQYLNPGTSPNPTVVLLTPGIYNSAYFEHSFLAKQMGIELVEGRDLIVEDKKVYMRTTKGFQKVDVIYRRIDDTFLDPQIFNKESLLGVNGIMEAYKAGNVAIANAPGTGVADDKIIYAYVPEIIKYYIGEDPLLPNVPTYVCWDKKEREHVIQNIDKLVVKPANESGGYGILIGSDSTEKERNTFIKKINSEPRNYIAQETISLSTVPVIVGDHFECRHVDFRPFTLYGEDIYVLPGGLTRVALTKGSLIVNSSQGGGSKDTWVLEKIPT